MTERRDSSPYRALNVGYTLLAAIAVGWVIGWWIDDLAGTAPLWTVIMIAAFIVAGLYQVVKEYWPRDDEGPGANGEGDHGDGKRSAPVPGENDHVDRQA